MKSYNVMVRMVSMMITHLDRGMPYDKFWAWLSTVEDWVISQTQNEPRMLGPEVLWTVIRISIMPELFDDLEEAGALGLAMASPGG